MKKLKAIIAWCVSLFFILFGILPWGNTITNILFILTALCIMPPVADKLSENFSKYTKKTKWIIFTVLLISAFCTVPTTNVVEVNNNEVEQYLSGEYSIDYLSAESIESDLNEDEDIKNKIVRFSVKEYVESTFGYNAQAGEHLNFISEADLKLKENDEVVGKVTSFKKFLDTWIVYYDVIEIIPAIEEKIEEVDKITDDSVEITDNTDVDNVIKIPTNNEKENNKPEIKDATEETKDNSEKDEQAKKEAEEKAKLEAEAKAKQEAEEKAKLEAEAKAKAEAEEKARLEAEAKAKKEAEEQAKKQETTAETSTDLVWVTKTGKRYHRVSNCGNTKTASQETKAKALSRGLTACDKCY